MAIRKVLIWTVLVLAVVWGGYWFIGAHLIERQLEQWIAAERGAGRTANFARLRVQGFPSRFDIHAEGIDLRDPVSGWGWQAPIAELAALSYQPQRIIATLPPTQQLTTPFGALTLTAGSLRAGLAFTPGLSFQLDHANLVADTVAITPASGPLEGFGMAAGAVRIAVQRAAGDDRTQRLGVELRDVILPQALLAQWPTLPPRLQRAHLDATVTFTAGWDRHALAERPQPVRIRLDDLSGTWGAFDLTLSGTLDVDAEGRPEGRLDLQMAGWRQLLDLLAAAGQLTERSRALAERTLLFTGGPAGTTPEHLRAQLVARDGVLWLGALPLGPAPRLRLP